MGQLGWDNKAKVFRKFCKDPSMYLYIFINIFFSTGISIVEMEHHPLLSYQFWLCVILLYCTVR